MGVQPIFGAFAIVLILASGAGYFAMAAPASPGWGPADTHIDHVVIILMENRAFDNYFGTYCPAVGPYCSSAVDGEPPGLCVPNVPQGGEPGLSASTDAQALDYAEEQFESNEINSTAQVNQTFLGYVLDGNASTSAKVKAPTLELSLNLSVKQLTVTAHAIVAALPKGAMVATSITLDWAGVRIIYPIANRTGTFGLDLSRTFSGSGTYPISGSVSGDDGGVAYTSSTPVVNVTLAFTGPCTKPFELGVDELSTRDLPHNYPNTVGSIDGGRMDGFYKYEDAGTTPFGYYNSSTIPFYWDLAEQYGLGDYFFSSAESFSLPNHWFLIAGSAPPSSILVPTKTPGGNTPQYRHQYLNQSNATYTVEDMLNATPSVSWKYYDWTLPTYQAAINCQWGVYTPCAFNYWNPLAAKAESYTEWYVTHFVGRDQVFYDAENGTLPNISYVIPYPTFSNHAGEGNISTGEAFLAQVIDALEAGPEWDSTAIFLSWDDYGGWYDGVAPPLPVGSPGTPINDTNVSADLSMRVPLLVISPYTPVGLVDNSLGYFESLLHFVEWRFGLRTQWGAPCINSRDCNAPLPFSYFDFNQTARPPIQFPTNWTNNTYPMALQGDAAIPCPNNCSIDPGRWNTDTQEGTLQYTEDDDD